MDNIKFTKGNWIKELSYIGEGLHIYTIHVNNKRICDIRRLNPMGVIDIEEQKANAKLIVSAPEMFEMLKEILEIRIINLNKIEQLLTKITE